MYAKLIKHSMSTRNSKEIWTFELEYPRIVHAEFMTHRLFSRNAASSRAIPIDKLIGLVETELAMPSEWGLNEKGMQARLVHQFPKTCEWAWKQASVLAVGSARILQKLGLHKQICNRLLEPFQNIKVVLTTTELDNWWWLRDHDAADPTIAELARHMRKAVEGSVPLWLAPNEYHVPYVDTTFDGNENIVYSVNGAEVSLDDAIKISTSCCAQVSYRVLDESLEKALNIYDQLVTMSPVHASPFEHVATPMLTPTLHEGGTIDPRAMEKGEHIDSNGDYWSGNFRGWYQYRQSIENNAKWSKDE